LEHSEKAVSLRSTYCIVMTDESDATSEAEQPRGASVQFSVPEMDCPSCAGKVDNGLQRVDGVLDADLRPTTGTAAVTYDPDRASDADVLAAIEGAGYEVAGGGADADTDPSDGVDVAPPAEIWTSTRAIKTWIGAILLALGLLIEFLGGTPNPAVGSVLGRPITLADALLVGAATISGLPVVRAGYYSARARSLDIDLLMGTAIVAATGIGYFVEAATLAVLFSVAELLEDYAMDRARDSLRELLELSPEEATVRRDGREVTVPAEDVAVGETVIVRPGEKIPLDGVVVDGESAVDESPITGESVPADKHDGDEVYAGSINEEGYLEVEATSAASDSTLARIVEMVQGAQANQTETEQFVDRFADYYTPVVVAFAILTAAIPPLLTADPISVDVAGYALSLPADWGPWFVRGLTLLVIACPCAFVISTPVSVVSGVTAAAKNGVLIKGGNYLEAMNEVDVVALDKTGTLTKGELAVTDVVPLGERGREDVLRRAAGLERRSEHPIADAVLARADEAGVDDLLDPAAFESLTGRGISAEFGGETYYAGKPALFEDIGFQLGRGSERSDGGTTTAARGGDRDVGDVVADLERDGKTVVLVGTASELLGVIAIADEVRPNARRAVERLRSLGVGRVVMLTGDNDGTARAIADQVGVDEYRAELLPEEKVAAIEGLQTGEGRDGESASGGVAMVGDGINDAPALAVAEVGVAMGAAGTDAALETADIALMGDDLSKLPYLYGLSNQANDVIRQNVVASLAVKALLAVGVPVGLVSVAAAVVIGDMGMSLGVTGNAMRLSRLTPERFLGE
jgi:Cd2+/Zn2+-exporting ATPase